jgi:hypothetical protein
MKQPIFSLDTDFICPIWACSLLRTSYKRDLIAMIKHNSLEYNALVMKIALSLDSRTKGGCGTFQKHI